MVIDVPITPYMTLLSVRVCVNGCWKWVVLKGLNVHIPIPLLNFNVE